MVGVSATWMQLYWSGLASPQPSKTTTATILSLGSFGWSANLNETFELPIFFSFTYLTFLALKMSSNTKKTKSIVARFRSTKQIKRESHIRIKEDLKIIIKQNIRIKTKNRKWGEVKRKKKKNVRESNRQICKFWIRSRKSEPDYSRRSTTHVCVCIYIYIYRRHNHSHRLDEISRRWIDPC